MDRDLIIFIHIPKTAGTTLARMLERRLGPRAMFAVDESHWEVSIAQFDALPESQRRRVQVLYGGATHLTYGLHALLARPATYITVLREPVERLISHYYFVRRYPTHYLYDQVTTQNLNLRDYVLSGLTTETDNGQTRQLCGPKTREAVGARHCTREMLQEAREHLESCPAFGLTEDFDRSLVLFKRTFQWDWPFYARENVTRNRPSWYDISPDALAAICDYNAFDLELYQFAQTLFQCRMAGQPASFQQDLVFFQRWNPLLGQFMGRLQETPRQVARAALRKLQPGH